MKSVKTTESSRVTRRFAGFYAISIGLLAIIFAGLIFGKSNALAPKSSIALSAFSNLSTEEQESILSTSAELEAAFTKLLDYDRQYLMLSGESGSSAQAEALRQSIEHSVQQVREKAENLKNNSTKFSVSTSARLAEQMANTYLVALDGRGSLTDLSGDKGEGLRSDPAGELEPGDKSDLLERDKRIHELEKIVAALRNAPLDTGDELKELNQQMTTEAGDARKRLDKATQLAAVLKTENTRLNEKISEMQRSTELKAKATAAYEKTMESVTADLSFMEIDCSLTRADAKQIISNSRQRRELLNDALETLNKLSQSPSPEIRKKAATRIAALNYISKNIRE